MTKEEKISAHQKLTDKIISRETEIAEDITEEIINFYDKKSENWNNLIETIISLMYISLKQTYQITLQEAKNIYHIENNLDKKITEEDIQPYLYNKDGLTLEERIEKHILEAKEKESYDQDDRNVLIFKEIRVLDNETLVVSHKLLKDAVKEKVEYGMVVGGGGCNRSCCSEGSNEWKPIDEIEEPPYHPNCTCEIIYSDPEDDDEEV